MGEELGRTSKLHKTEDNAQRLALCLSVISSKQIVQLKNCILNIVYIKYTHRETENSVQ